MTLSLYFFRQFLPSVGFATVLFVFVLLLDRIFDLIDLIFNKGVNALLIGKLLLLFLPTILPLSMPMAILLAALVSFGRLSEENEFTAVRAGGLSLVSALWMPVVFTLLLSASMVPFNTSIAPYANRAFRTIYEQIIHADPLINIEPRKFFQIRNIKLFADRVEGDSKTLHQVFLYQLAPDGRPTDRVFAQSGKIEANKEYLKMTLENGQLERYDVLVPEHVFHSSFGTYQISIPLKNDQENISTRYRNFTSKELRKMIQEMRAQGNPVSVLLAEDNLRYAMAFAPICLLLVGVPLAVVLKRGGRTFGFGITIVVLFLYYFLLIGGLTLAEKSILPPMMALWMANFVCLVAGGFLIKRMLKE
jgi:lipopolysaccharide export system permease protein